MGRKVSDQDRWIWPFELLEKIGEGGMGVVYRARSVTNDRQVALKLLPQEFATDKTLTARFEREMDVLKTLKHPHIVHCFGGTCEGKRRFYAMELVEGGTLYRLLKKKGPLSWQQTVKYALQMFAGLGHAHQHGVVHRDVKPGNFLVTKEGNLKLSDFGLAHVSTATKLTAAGKTLGTYQYMAPEQIRGSADISAQTDLYAMGCVLFEMLCGRPPFIGDSPAEILQQHLEAPPPSVSEYARGCPDSAMADLIISKLMEKPSNKRPSNAEAVADWIKDSTQSTEVGTARRPRAQRKSAAVPKTSKDIRTLFRANQGWLLLSCAVLLVLMLGWNLTLLSRSGTPAPVETASPTRAEALWIEALQSKQVAVRLAAVRALSEMGQDQDAAVRALIEGLSDEDPNVQEAIIVALGNLGDQADNAVVPLQKLHQRDDSPTVRRLAGEALVKISGTKTGPSL